LHAPKGPILTDVTDTKNVPASQLVDVPISSPVQAPTPPFPQRLVPIAPSKPNLVAIDLLDQLKQMTIQISLLDALKEIPLYNKTLKEVCTKKSARNKKDPPTVHMLGELSDLMLSKTLMPKYSNLGIHVVTIHINGIQIQNV